MEGHYSVIKSVTGVLNQDYYCYKCNKVYYNGVHRNCIYACDRCFSNPPCEKNSSLIQCGDCNRQFYGIECISLHKAKACRQFYYCKSCELIMSKRDEKTHICGKIYCKRCKDIKDYEHLCYVPKYVMQAERNNAKNKKKRTTYVYYDFETVQNLKHPLGERHVANLCVSHTVCESCMHTENLEEPCKFCGVRENVFKFDGAVDDEFCVVRNFLVYLQTLAKHSTIYALAHNLAFDAHFSLQYIYSQLSTLSRAPTLIMQGSKIYKLTFNNITFIDSLNFLNMKLADLPATFGLTTVKGWFPHISFSIFLLLFMNMFSK